MNYKISIIGGDLRIVKLAEMLAKDGNDLYLYGLEDAVELKKNSNIKFCKSIREAVENAQFVIGPIPFSSDGEHINTSFNKDKITIKELFNEIKEKVFIAGSISPSIKDIIDEKHIKVIDIMKKEELAILNTIATAEGTIEVAISNTDKILHGSNILILGFGRVAKTLAIKLKALSANVTCSARKVEDEAWINTYGYDYLNINQLGEDLNKFDIIINTVPHLILTEDKLKYVNKECLLMDVSSKPGGIDENAVKKYGLKMKWALALPGKVAPQTTAKFIKEIFYKITKEI